MGRLRLRRSSARVARDRLNKLITADRSALAGADAIERLQADILVLLKKNLRGGRIAVRQGVSRKLQVLEIDIDLCPRV